VSYEAFTLMGDNMCRSRMSFMAELLPGGASRQRLRNLGQFSRAVVTGIVAGITNGLYLSA